ncbi:Na(+)/H(+) exchange regulatory cofactor NHE-RF2-like [Rhipicephalus microplus]|uniref:Na(+)/H(+) exchange regulatory cofactor NHE-RF2-like n=1 Tax=Rhipicephalus microplus TaxID=6941 RepID=UPI003F6B7A65
MSTSGRDPPRHLVYAPSTIKHKDDGGKADPAKKGPSSTVKKTASSSSVTAAAPVRLCKLVRRPDFDGYGFGILVDEKSKLATVTTMEKGGPAEAGGLRAKDCIVQVNGESVIGYSQRDVVDRIRSSTKEVRLLVTNKETVATYKERGMSFSSDAPRHFPAKLRHVDTAQGQDDQGEKLQVAKYPEAPRELALVV